MGWLVRKVLHLRTVSGRGGGPEKTLLASPRFLADEYDLRLAYIRPAGDPDYDMPKRAIRAGVELVDISERGPADPRTVLSLAKEIRRFRPQLLHTHDYKTDVLGLILGRWFGLPVVTTLHGYVTLSKRLNLYYRVGRAALRRMDHTIAVGPDLYDLLGQLGLPPERRSYVENGIDVDAYQRRRSTQEAKRRLGFAPDRLLVGAVGRLQPEKGFDTLMSATAELLEQGQPVDLVIAGDGPLRTALSQQIQQLGQAAHIRLLGHRNDVMELLEAMDIFALSSVREGLPNVLLEAMAMEVPAVATAVGAVPTVITPGADGLLVASQNQRELQQALTRLIGDGALRRSLASQARQTVEQRFSFQRRMQRIRAIYDRVLTGTSQKSATGALEETSALLS